MNMFPGAVQFAYRYQVRSCQDAFIFDHLTWYVAFFFFRAKQVRSPFRMFLILIIFQFLVGDSFSGSEISGDMSLALPNSLRYFTSPESP